MTNHWARSRQSGSFTAGLLIGLSIVVATFAVSGADSSAWQIFLVVGAPVILVLGIAVQVLDTAKPWRRRATSTEREVFPYALATAMNWRWQALARTHRAADWCRSLWREGAF